MRLPQANAYGEVFISWKLEHNNHQLMIKCTVLISYCVCRRPSWKQKTQPNGCSAVVWLSFWFSTRFTRKTLDHSVGNYLYLLGLWRKKARTNRFQKLGVAHLYFCWEHTFLKLCVFLFVPIFLDLFLRTENIREILYLVFLNELCPFNTILILSSLPRLLVDWCIFCVRPLGTILFLETSFCFEKRYIVETVFSVRLFIFLVLKVNSARVNTFFSSESSWKPKTQPNDSRAAVWLSLFSTRPSADTVTN